MQLGAAHARAKARPAAAAGIEPQPGRIDQIGSLGQGAAQPAMGAGDRQRQQFAEHRVWPRPIGVGQGCPARQRRPDVVEPRRMAVRTGDDSRKLAAPASWP